MSNSDNRTPVAILGLCPNGLGVIRSLAPLGMPLLGYDYTAGKPGFHSRHVKARLCPNPYNDASRLLDFLVACRLAGPGKPILMPTSDEFVLFISRHREALAPYYDFSLPPAEVLESLLNKRWQYRKAAAAGIAIPDTFYPETAADIDPIARELVYPAIIKPCHTHLWKERFAGIKGFRVEDAAQLREKLELVLEKKIEVVVQNLVPGPTTNMYEVCSYLDRDGRAHGTFIKHKLRQFPCGMGLGSLVESVVDPQLAQDAETLLSAIGCRGHAEVEYKLDPRDGRYKMIEINARLTLQNALSTRAGINLPAIQYAELTGGPIAPAAAYPAGLQWIWLELDYEAVRRCDGEPGLWRWLLSLGQPDCAAVFSREDPSPFRHVIGAIVRRRLGSRSDRDRSGPDGGR